MLVDKQAVEDFSGKYPMLHEEQIHKSATEKRLTNTVALLHKMISHEEIQAVA